PRPASRHRPRTPRASSFEKRTSRPSTPEGGDDPALVGLRIERPRSALHAGNFREETRDNALPSHSSSSTAALATSPVAPWHHAHPLRVLHGVRSTDRCSTPNAVAPPSRPRAASQSVFPSSFVLMPPTSPLVQQSNNTDLDQSLPPTLPSESPDKPSISSDASPLHHAPMVGSYEESILRGRMSTTPSKPLDFVARIGVLGRGDCRAGLKCPPHVTIPFPAVFYSYNGGNTRPADNSPSPYVGLIDLENTLSHPVEKNEAKKRRHTVSNPGAQQNIPSSATGHSSETQQEGEPRTKSRKRSTSPKAPPGGSYRIPQQGQLQIVIRNPNNTAVKLFLVPYDLSEMGPGQKTFIRQRSYSAGPIVDVPQSAPKAPGPGRPEALLSSTEDSNDRPVLRYLIHLHICCPSKGRYYLYKSIRVVFANRVPDGKEKLRNETQLPDPPYSPYRPHRDSMASQPSPMGFSQLGAEAGLRRKSAAFPLSQQAIDRRLVYGGQPSPPPPAIQLTGAPPNMTPTPVSAIRFQPPEVARTAVDPIPMEIDAVENADAAHSGPHLDSPFSPPGAARFAQTFQKLDRNDPRYGGRLFGGSGQDEGLLGPSLRG
ncbi:hypothetical protein M011DRAFT_381321, partial [Sporormia fimetaria CBS 119925]